MRMSKQDFHYQIYNEVSVLILLLSILAIQFGFAGLLSSVWGVWAWVLLYIFASIPAILTLVTVLVLGQSVIMAVRSKRQLGAKNLVSK